MGNADEVKGRVKQGLGDLADDDDLTARTCLELSMAYITHDPARMRQYADLGFAVALRTRSTRLQAEAQLLVPESELIDVHIGTLPRHRAGRFPRGKRVN